MSSARALAGYNRSCAGRLLREQVRAPTRRNRRRRGRTPAYGPELVAPLAKVWATLGGICGKRLWAVMERTVSALERHGELELKDEARGQMLAMSAATIDRLLPAKRRRLRLKGMSHTKCRRSSNRVPLRTTKRVGQRALAFSSGATHHLRPSVRACRLSNGKTVR